MSSGSLFLIISSLLASSSTRADAFAFSPPLTTTTTTSISISNNDNRPNYYCHLRKATPLNLFPFMKGKGGNAHNQDNNNSNDDDHSKQPQNNKKYSPLEDEPWKNDDSYWDMLQKASKDPETFEKFIEESVAKKKLGHATSLVSSSSSSATAELGTASSEGGESSTSSPKKRGTYQRIEEWDAQRKNGDGNSMSEEERLQWECQKMGNQFRQNEILRHHLNSF